MATRPDDHARELPSGDVAGTRTVEELALLLRRLRRREARRRAGAELTYRRLAAKAGWSHTVVAAYLTGKILPPTDRFDTLIRLLGATPAEQGALATARDRVEEGRRGALPAPRRPVHDLPTPHQLPADVLGFTGRGTDLAALDLVLGVGRQASTVVTAAVTGTAGVGKTALAVHWAHRVKTRFPHGQLYADLRGHSPDPPADPERVLDSYLAALGVPPGAAPRDPDAKAALYRSLLDGRRLLVVLDNAASPQQVRPLLPGSPGCLVVVTSRSTLTGLVARDRAQRICLDALPLREAVALLAGFVGAARVAAEPAAAAELARLCACLPVALCAAGERAAARPHVPLASLVSELAAADNRLDLLDAGEDRHTAVRTVLSWSYRQLPPAAARVFRLLGAHPGGDVDRQAVAVLAGTDLEEAGRLIDALAAGNLLRPERAGRYSLHGLLRLYAAECARAEPPGRRMVTSLAG